MRIAQRSASVTLAKMVSGVSGRLVPGGVRNTEWAVSVERCVEAGTRPLAMADVRAVFSNNTALSVMKSLSHDSWRIVDERSENTASRAVE